MGNYSYNTIKHLQKVLLCKEIYCYYISFSLDFNLNLHESRLIQKIQMKRTTLHTSSIFTLSAITIYQDFYSYLLKRR